MPTLDCHSQFLLKCMRLFGLFPTTSLDHPEPRPWDHVYPLVLSLLAWLGFFRICSILVWIDGSASELVNGLLYIGYYFAGAVCRSSMTYINYRSTKTAIRLLDNDNRFHPTEQPSSFQQGIEQHFSRKNKTPAIMVYFCWFFVLFNSLAVQGLVLYDRQQFQGAFTPFGQLEPYDQLYYLGMPVVEVLLAINDTGIMFSNAFVVIATLLLGNRFVALERWIEERASECQLESLETKSTDSSQLPPFQVEEAREFHLQWMEEIKHLDKACRHIIGFSMVLGFLGVLFTIYLLAWGKGDFLFRVVYFVWMVTAFFFLLVHMVGSALLNKRSTDVTERLFLIPTKRAFNDDRMKSNFNMIFFAFQATVEPIALTFFDMVYLKTETIIAVMGAVTTYFLILVDFSNQTAGPAANATNSSAEL